VFSEASELGLNAMEQGALGWLPSDPAEQRAIFDRYGMELIGGFVPLVLHVPSRLAEMRGEATRIADAMLAAGGRHFVTAVIADTDDWSRPDIDTNSWETLLRGLDEIGRVVADRGAFQVVHPHVNTLIETADELDRFLDGCSAPLCFDTGHLSLGGADVAALAGRCGDRIGLVHLKDVDASIARRQRSGELTLMEGAQAGLFPSLGDGAVPVAEVIETLVASGYDGWYVIEQDRAFFEEPPAGAGPVLGVARSLEFLRGVEQRLNAGVGAAPAGS
jgi:inosose dehydratase